MSLGIRVSYEIVTFELHFIVKAVTTLKIYEYVHLLYS